MRATHTIAGSTTLQRTLWLKRGTRIAIALPTFSVVQQENLEVRFNRQLSESGSEFCALALIASLVGCILFDAGHWSLFTVHSARMIAANLFVCLAAALLGKTLGVLRARWQLARLIWAVAERLEADAENAVPLGDISTPRGERFAMNNRRASIY